MRKILAMVSMVAFVGAAVPAWAQAMQVPQAGNATPVLKCADFKHNSDGSWAPVREVPVVFPDGTILTIAPNVTFSANGTWMGMPFSLVLNEQCVK